LFHIRGNDMPIYLSVIIHKIFGKNIALVVLISQPILVNLRERWTRHQISTEEKSFFHFNLTPHTEETSTLRKYLGLEEEPPRFQW